MSSFYISFNVGTVEIQQTQIEGKWGKSLDFLGNAPDSMVLHPMSVIHFHPLLTQVDSDTGVPTFNIQRKGKRGSSLAPNSQIVLKSPPKPPM